MAKKVIKKKKLKIVRLLLVLLCLGVLLFGLELYLRTSTKNIVITGTSYLKDDYIIDIANIKDYPSFYFISTPKIEKALKKSPYIIDANIKRKIYHKLEINIKENTPLFINRLKNTIVFSNKEEVNTQEETDLFRIPSLTNTVDENYYNSLIKHMKKIDKNILGKISEISYVPNEYDKERFLLFMDDSNSVYLTLSKFKMINYYNDVLENLEGKHGILYLDSGNHFQVME